MEEFIKASRKLGDDKTLVQGPGGNTSIKVRDLLYVKASGTLLKNISKTFGISCCKFMLVKQSLTSSHNERKFLQVINESVVKDKSFGQPSMETGFHAAISSKYVIHLHSIYPNVISSAKFGNRLLKKILVGTPFLSIDYTNPGFTLAKKLSRKKKLPPLIILRNHGIIVHGDRLNECIKLVQATNESFKYYLAKQAVSTQFKISNGVAGRKHTFPDSAVFGSKNSEIASANRYIIDTIKQLKLKPRYLSKAEVNKLLNMVQEKYRLSLK